MDATTDAFGFVGKACPRCGNGFSSPFPGIYELCSVCALDDEKQSMADVFAEDGWVWRRDSAADSKLEVVNMTDVNNLQPIETNGVDLRQFEGKRVKLDAAEVLTVPSRFASSGQSEVLKVWSEPLATIQDREGNEKEVRASELFNLTRGENDALGWPNGPNGKLASFMKKLGVKHPSQLAGKQVTVRIRTKTGADGTPRDFLGFITG